MPDKALELGGAFFGILGACLLAVKSDYSAWGFVSYVISNCFLIPFAFRVKARSLVIMYITYTITSLTGVYTWFIR